MLGLVIGNPEEYVQRRHCRDMYLNLGMVSAFHVNWRRGISLGSSATVSCGVGHIQRSLDARCRTAGAVPGINDGTHRIPGFCGNRHVVFPRCQRCKLERTQIVRKIVVDRRSSRDA